MIARINEETLKKGNAIIFDEAGVGISAREWYSFNNKAINYILQTFRFRNLVVIFTVPYLNYIDSNVRKMFDFVIECKSVNKQEKKNVVKVMRLQYNKITGDMYKKHLIYNVNGKIMKIKLWKFKKADKELLKRYEELSQEFKKEVGYDLEKMSRKMDRKDKDRQVNLKEIAEKVYKDKETYLKTYGKRIFIDSLRIENNFSIGARKGKKVKDMVEQMLKKEV